MAETLPYHILLNLQVLINKIGTVKTVRHDASHMCRCQNDILGLLFIKKLLHSLPVQQIQLFVRTAYQIGISFCCKLFHIADPTSPWWPATYILAVFSIILLFEPLNTVSSRTSYHASP